MSRVTLTGKFTRIDGTPASGTVRVTPSRSPIMDSAGRVVISGPQSFPVQSGGLLEVEIPASNDPDLGPAFTYRIEVILDHASWKISKVWLPHGSTTVDLSQVSDFEPTPGVATRVVTIPADGTDGQVLVWDGAGFAWDFPPEGPKGDKGDPGTSIENPETLARTVLGKNLYNPATDILDQFYDSRGILTVLEGYRTTDFIPVTPGLPYTDRMARFITYWDSQKQFISESRVDIKPQSAGTHTPPEGAAYMRLSYFVSTVGPENQQIEQSATATIYEPWHRRLDPSIVVDTTDTEPPTDTKPLTVTYDGNLIETQSMLGSDTLTVRFLEEGRENNVFNFSPVSLGSDTVAIANDDVAPVRTQQSTVGGNHGIPAMQRWPAGTHDKTTADLGSTWTDGVDEFALISIDPNGAALFGRKYTVAATGEAATSWTTPAGDLTHTSGATNTSTLALADRSDIAQLRPWAQRHHITTLLDGQPLVTGEATTGHELTIRESYEILDIRHVYDWATTHVGQHYTTAIHRGAVGVESEWTIRPGGKMRLKAALWEISPTRLGNTGFLQAGGMINSDIEGAVTRWLPGVGPIDGLNWDEGVDLALLTTSQNVTASDLIDPSTPPTTLVDARDDMALAVAVSPWRGASERATRLASTPDKLWDLRSTRKIYPNVLNGVAPGWGRIEAEGIRAYLTLEEAQAVVTDADALSAWVTLDQIVG